MKMEIRMLKQIASTILSLILLDMFILIPLIHQSSVDTTLTETTSISAIAKVANDSSETYSTVIPGSEWTDYCPCRTCRYNEHGWKEILCDTGGIVDIPFEKISSEVEVIDISAPNDKPNNLILGPLFYRFPKLKKLRITKSNIPAIGSTTFRYRTSLLVLDLSQNRIEHLIDSNFRGLSQLKMLNLSHNNLSELASGTFQQLYNLKHLSLAHNRLNTITPRLFYNLTSLETLDLSHNPIEEIPPKNVIDLRPLRHLSLAHCRLRQIHSLFYQHVPHLVVLDLQANLLSTIHANEFSALHNLTGLYLNHNQLSNIEPFAFAGLNLETLDLSNNVLSELNENTFTNGTIRVLNISDNSFTRFDSKLFYPLAYYLQVIAVNNVQSLKEPSASVSKILLPLKTLDTVELSNLSLDSIGLNQDLFANNRRTLRHINISHNSFVNISGRMFEELDRLEILDVSNNSLYELSSEFLYVLTQFKNLSRVYFDNNPWSCYRCHLLYFRNWINKPPEQDGNGHNQLNPYQKACRLEQRCAVCRMPPSLAGSQVDQIEEWQLEWCTDPTVQLRVSTTEPNVGLVLALLIIIILIIVIIGVIVYYRNRGAIYFTNEELLYGGRGSLETNDEYDAGTHKSSIYNVSNAIKYFADATAASPRDSMSFVSVDSIYNRRQRNSQTYQPSQHHARIMNEPSFTKQSTTNNGGQQLYAQINRQNSRTGKMMIRPQDSFEIGTTRVKRLSSDASILSTNQRNRSSQTGNILNFNDNNGYKRGKNVRQCSVEDPDGYRSLRIKRSQSSAVEESRAPILSQRSSTLTKQKSGTKKVLMLNGHHYPETANNDGHGSHVSPRRKPTGKIPPPSRPMMAKPKSISSSSNSSTSGVGNKKKDKREISAIQATIRPVPPPPPPTSYTTSSSSSESSSASSTDTDISDKHNDEEEEEDEKSNVSMENLMDPIDRAEGSNEEDEEDDGEDDVSSREPSPSGSIDLSPPTELPIMRPHQPCSHDGCNSSSMESLNTAALAENGGDSISDCSIEGGCGVRGASIGSTASDDLK